MNSNLNCANHDEATMILSFGLSTASGTASVAPGVHLQLEHVSISMDASTISSAWRILGVCLAAISTSKTTLA